VVVAEEDDDTGRLGVECGRSDEEELLDDFLDAGIRDRGFVGESVEGTAGREDRDERFCGRHVVRAES